MCDLGSRFKLRCRADCQFQHTAICVLISASSATPFIRHFVYGLRDFDLFCSITSEPSLQVTHMLFPLLFAYLPYKASCPEARLMRSCISSHSVAYISSTVDDLGCVLDTEILTQFQYKCGRHLHNANTAIEISAQPGTCQALDMKYSANKHHVCRARVTVADLHNAIAARLISTWGKHPQAARAGASRLPELSEPSELNPLCRCRSGSDNQCSNSTLNVVLNAHVTNDHGAEVLIAYYDPTDGIILGGASWTNWDSVVLPVGVCLSGQIIGLDGVYTAICCFTIADHDDDTPNSYLGECAVNRAQLHVADGCYKPPARRPWFRLDESTSAILAIISLIFALHLYGLYRWCSRRCAQRQARTGDEQVRPLIDLDHHNVGDDGASHDLPHPELVRTKT